MIRYDGLDPRQALSYVGAVRQGGVRGASRGRGGGSGARIFIDIATVLLGRTDTHVFLCSRYV